MNTRSAEKTLKTTVLEIKHLLVGEESGNIGVIAEQFEGIGNKTGQYGGVSSISVGAT